MQQTLTLNYSIGDKVIWNYDDQGERGIATIIAYTARGTGTGIQVAYNITHEGEPLPYWVDQDDLTLIN